MTNSAITMVALYPPGTAWQALGGLVSKQPWTREVLDMLRISGADFESPYTNAPVFLLPAQFDAACRSVHALRESGLSPVLEYGTIKNPSPWNIHSTKWYGVKYPDISNDFLTEDLFENEWPCELPMPSVLMNAGGCSLRKRQVRKLRVGRRGKLNAIDVVSASTAFFSSPWQVLVASARLRDALLNSDLTGFSFLPVADNQASADDLLLDKGPCASDSTEWFQWVIDGRAKPKPIDDFISARRVDGKRDCSICGRRTGDPQPQPLFGEDLLDGTADVQIFDEFELPDGRRIMNVHGGMVASSRFVEFCLKGRFKGLSSLTGTAPSFTALYFGPAV